MTPQIEGVKFMLYLDACSAETGQMQVMPGSHLAPARSAFWEYLGQDPTRQGHPGSPARWPTPAFGIDTQPGDVIAFHSNLLHSSVGGTSRMAWDIYYLKDPILHGAEQCETIRDAVLHIGDYAGMEFDHDKWSVWEEWANGGGDVRLTAVRRLRRIGVLDVPGAGIGLPEWEPRQPRSSSLWVSGAPAARRSAG
jgi:hypothetical protein